MIGRFPVGDGCERFVTMSYRMIVVLTALTLVGVVAPAASGQPPDTTRLLSRALDGDPANGLSGHPSVSDNGRVVAFTSSASDLVVGDDNGLTDIFVRDRRTDQTKRVSVDMSGGSPNAPSSMPQIAAKGRHVVYLSRATDLTSVNTHGKLQAYLYDRDARTTTLVSVNAAGEAGNDDTTQVVVNKDGSLVAFVSEATNLVADDTNGVPDVFLHGVSVGGTRLITRAPDGSLANLSSYAVDISNSGKMLAIASSASNLVPDDTNGASDVFMYDRKSGGWDLISRNKHGDAGDGHSYEAVISADGEYVAFTSVASDLTEDEDNFLEDVFLYRSPVDRIDLVSRGLDGTTAAVESYVGSISRDGRAVTFYSDADDLVEGDTNDDTDVFLFRRARRQAVSLVSTTKDGASGNSTSLASSVSASGKIVVFDSQASDLVRHDENENRDVFARRVS
jgi:Tol biopolymer transport system component